MKIWTYAEARDKILVDHDLQDQTFITPNELIGYFNEGIEEAESEVVKIDEDYLLTSYPIPLILGTSSYLYPANMYAFKERGIIYANGSIIYPVRRFQRKDKFVNQAFASQYAGSDDYQWFHTNDSAGAAAINLIPAARETATVPPLSSTFTPMTLWYIRHASRIPLLGEYVPQYEILAQQTAVNVSSNALAVSKSYVTGDLVKLTSNGSVPTGLVAGTIYYVISISATSVKLATTLANAQAGTPIDITALGTGTLLSIALAATQTIVDNTPIDIPEFTKFVIQWAKCRCFEKEGDPRLDGAAKTLTQQRDQMVSTLTEMQQDDENEVVPDLSSYRDMS